jgi:hypothetical protein
MKLKKNKKTKKHGSINSALRGGEQWTNLLF